MPITLFDALRLLPSSIADDRGKNFVRIVYWLCCEHADLDPATIPPSLIPYKLAQFGMGPIAGLATRLPIADQRQLLAESAVLMELAGTPRSIKRVLEIFGYPGATFLENPIKDNIRQWGEFEVITQQPFRYNEVEAIINTLKPPSRKLTSIRFINAIVLKNTRLLDGSSNLEGLAETEPAPQPWLDAATAFIPNPSEQALVLLTNTQGNHADNFNAQIQGLINNIKFEIDALAALGTRVNAMSAAIASLGGGTIDSQLSTINQGITALQSSNNALSIRLANLTPTVNALVTSTNQLETQASTISAGSNLRQLDSTVQRKHPTLSDISALIPGATFPTDRVIATATDNTLVLQNTPPIGIFIPQVASLVFKQPAGTNAGNYTAPDVWAAMPFTVASNDDDYLSVVSASRFTIPSGTYFVTYNWQGCGCLSFGARIWNVTTGTVIEQGSAGQTVTGGGSIGDTWAAEGTLLAVFSVTGNTQIEFQFKAKILHPNGAGLTAGQSTANAIEQVYQQAVLMRVYP
jgi:P2-related tail formation protein